MGRKDRGASLAFCLYAKHADIYWGAVPFVLLQILMVAVVIIFPEIVGHSPINAESGIVEVPVESDPGAGYLLPPEWR